MATKNERDKELYWFDIINAIIIIGIAKFLGYGGIITILILCIIYTLTLRNAWIFLFPNFYKELICSECNKVISQESTECQNCGAQFNV